MKFVKFIRLILAISIVSSATSVTAQDKPAEQPEVVVEGSNDAVVELKQQLQSVRAELEKVTAQAALRAQQLEANAQQLEAKQRALVEQERQIAAVKQEARLAEEQIKSAQKAAAESMMQAEKARVEAEKAKVEAAKALLTQELGIPQYKAMLHYVENKQGPEHAYSQQLKLQLMELEQELAKMSQQLGPQHPKVVQTMQQLKDVRSQLKKVDAKPGVPVVLGHRLSGSAVGNSAADEKSNVVVEGRNLLADPEAMEKLRDQIADEAMQAQLSALDESRAAAERARQLYEQQLVSRRELAEQEGAVALQLRRTQEMLEMQKRLLSAQNVANVAVVAGHRIKPENTEERFDRLEQKLDKIASLLEKLVETKE